MTLTEFLTARYAEKEAEASDWHDARRCGGFDRDGGFELKWCDCGYPARVLREVEAGRKILAAYQRAQAATSADSWESDYTQALEWAARVLAAVDRDHPDYDPAWEPGT